MVPIKQLRRREIGTVEAPSGKWRKRKWSRCRGVSWNVRDGYWVAYIVTGRYRHLGYFATEREAALAYDRAARSSFGPDAILNQRQRWWGEIG
jgi:hypothetical protein